MVKITSNKVLRCSTADARSDAPAPYSRFRATENCEIAGEWLKANTSTGTIIQMDIAKSPNEGTPPKPLRFQPGMRKRLMPNRIRISG